MVTPTQRTAPPIRSARIEYVRKTVGTGYLSTLPVFLTSTKVGLSPILRRMTSPTTTSTALSRSGMRQPSIILQRTPPSTTNAGLSRVPTSALATRPAARRVADPAHRRVLAGPFASPRTHVVDIAKLGRP